MKQVGLFLFLSTVSLFSLAQEKGDWFKKGTMYNVDVKVFQDSDHDGIGDLRGLTQKLGYLDSLGIDMIWLAPFQPSPLLDDGYDVADYYGIDPRVGTMADFKAFLQECKKHKIRVVMDMVINHSSTQHPWFQDARAYKDSPYRNWYVWSEQKPENERVGMAFPGVQPSIWTYDTLASAYYYHRFYTFQPDLNMQNPAVKREVKKILAYWLALGVSGFRLDAVPFVIEVPSTQGDNFKRQNELLTEFRSFVDSVDHDAVLLGEANVPPEENDLYFGPKGEGISMMFNFFVNQHLFYALATSRTQDVISALERTHTIPPTANWAQFLRNHDEIDLGRLSYFKAKRVYRKFAPERYMLLYDRGIRRRLAPMLNHDLAFLTFAYSVLFSLPSTPVIRYGEEIGMGDDLTLKERESVRTPMQWNGAPNSGFSTSPTPFRPVIDSGEYAFSKVNVRLAQQDSASLYHRIEDLIAFRRNSPELQLGTWKLLPTSSRFLLAFDYQYQGKHVLVVHNFHPKEKKAVLSFPEGNLAQLKGTFTTPFSLHADTKGEVKWKIKGRTTCWFRY